MKLVLMGCIASLVLIMIGALLRLRKPNQQATRRKQREKAAALDELPADCHDPDVVLGLKPEADSQDNLSNPPLEYVVLHVMAQQNKAFIGYELLQALLGSGLRFDGKEKIFHAYHEQLATKMFALVSTCQPGIFDLQNMGKFSCPGLTLFMVLEDAEQPQQFFERMLQVAQQLAEDLGGVVCHETRRPLTEQDLTLLRQQIQQNTAALLDA